MSICLLRYEVGDKIVLRSDLVDGEEYGNTYYNDEMDYLKDTDGSIIDYEDLYCYCYNIDDWVIVDEMIDHDKTRKLQSEECVNMSGDKKELTIMDLEVGKEYTTTSIYGNKYNALYEVSSSGDVIITYGLSKQKKDITEVFTTAEIIDMRFKEVNRLYKETIQYGDMYYYITDGCDIDTYSWDDGIFDNSVANGLGIYRTKEEAKAMYDKIIEFVKNERNKMYGNLNADVSDTNNKLKTILEGMRESVDNDDWECAHYDADELLVKLIQNTIGSKDKYKEDVSRILEAYRKVGKWYS